MKSYSLNCHTFVGFLKILPGNLVSCFKIKIIIIIIMFKSLRHLSLVFTVIVFSSKTIFLLDNTPVIIDTIGTFLSLLSLLKQNVNNAQIDLQCTL